MNRILFSVSLIVLFNSCAKDEIVEPITSTVEKYLHISHTRTNTNPDMDNTAEGIDYSDFDMLWLGGDLAYLSSEDDTTMDHVDSIFDIGNENTLWALGNHDYSDLDRIEEYTNRRPYYTYHKNGLTFIILDTQNNLSSITGEQQVFFEGVVDTMEASSHLVVLHHKLIWMYGDTELEPQIATVSNGELGDCFYCINPNNFHSDIYPKLLEVKQKEIEVLCIGGDIGYHVKEYEHITSDGIYFLASGISNGAIGNKALLFDHDLTDKKLTWKYELLAEL